MCYAIYLISKDGKDAFSLDHCLKPLLLTMLINQTVKVFKKALKYSVSTL